MKNLFRSSLLAVFGLLLAVPVFALDAPSLAPHATSTSLTKRVKIKRGYIRLKGNTEAEHNIILKINGKRKLKSQTLTADEDGNFDIFFPLANKKKNKKMNVAVYAEDPDTGEMSAATMLYAKIPKSNAVRTYTAAGVKNYCEIEGNSYEPVRGAAITAYLATEKGAPIKQVATTTTDSDGQYELDLPRGSNILIQVVKQGYKDKRDSMLVDLRLNSKNGNINQYLYLCSR